MPTIRLRPFAVLELWSERYRTATGAPHLASSAFPLVLWLDAMQKLRELEEKFEIATAPRLRSYPRTARIVNVDDGS